MADEQAVQQGTFRGMVIALLIGAAVPLAIGGYAVWSVETRGCNPFLDQPEIGVPICHAE